ncbi:hypothetical protein DDE18_12685 [Nocardioides gansuensis]|uniref:STAS domain-containing protein n=1 Tax=Nocardioides gansuensis TaxID=2138300 RepID=A0A2T8F9H7_9ACTN|nr:hypothetical protein [Nocardioides gansuensis]PVG82339.1 hypothetical protein DDE18_12685 [Nocardioides gansuensis]
MSLHITHRAGALVVRAVAAAREDCLAQLNSVLGNLLSSADRVVLDLSEVMLAPSERVVRFMQHLTSLSLASGCEIVVVAERLSARRVLRAASPGRLVGIVPTLAAALGEHPSVPGPRPVTTLRAVAPIEEGVS